MKKQIAVLMAAATAVTTVAPAIANADVNNHDASVSEITGKVKDALNTKYANKNDNGVEVAAGSLAKDYLNSRYVVLATGGPETKNSLKKDFKNLNDSAYNKYNYRFEIEEGKFLSKDDTDSSEWYVVDNASKLATALEANLTDTTAKVAIVDKGADKDGNASRTTTKKHYVKNATGINDDQEVSLSATAKTLFEKARTADGENKDIATYVKSLKVDNKLLVSDKKQIGTAPNGTDAVNKIELTLTSNVEYTLEVNDDALDLTEARDKDGNIVKLDANNTQDVMDKIAKFELEANKDDREVSLDIVNGDTEVYNLEDAVEESLGLNNIYTREDGYTSEGKDFVNGLVNSKKEPYKFNFRGTNYVLDGTVEEALDNNFANAKIDKSGDGYKLTFNVKVKDANDEDVKKTLKFVVKGDKQRDLYDVLRDLKGSVEVVSGHFTKLAGSNRYATAIEVSAEQFKPEKADSVVIVGGKAQLDGLAAAPLASAKNAPILLADPNTGLNRDTIKEIDRACSSLKNKTVYIVGGEQSVPAKVVKQLEDEFGAVVQRVAGSNRKTTSVEVAKRLNYDKKTQEKAFIIGSEGAADAMSVSSVASTLKDGKVSPIIVVDAKGLDRNTREFISTDLKAKNAYLIGGEKSLNTQVLRDVKLAVDSVARISGDNRYDTNVNVIEEFYSNEKEEGADAKIEAKGAIFASGENAYLVDAQTSGAFAAENGLPIVLAGNKLTNDQIDLMKKDGVLDGKRSNIYQVGGVVSSDVMKVVVDKLDL